MSWLFADFLAGTSSPRRAAPVAPGTHDTLHAIESDTIRLVAGGLAATCLRGESKVDGDRRDWIVLGIGLRRSGATSEMLDASAWRSILSKRSPEIASLDGHFVVVRWSDRELECFSDQLGMRTMYIVRSRDRCTISTRTDWLAGINGGRAIDLAALGAHWLLTNQMASRTLVEGVERLGQSGYFVWSSDRSQLTETPWQSRPNGGDDSVHVLDAMIQPTGLGDRRVSLGLSGGLDSRVLLALLLSRERDRQDSVTITDEARDAIAGSLVAANAAGRATFDAHVFGTGTDPDVVIAKRIAAGERLQLRLMDDPLPDAATCDSMLRDYVGWTAAIEPASAIMKLRYYPVLESLGRAVVDGGLGEIARREYLKRLLITGREAIRRRDATAILRHVRVGRADVFDEATMRSMRAGAIEQIERMLSTMPPADEIGGEEFVDLMAIRTRFPYWAGLEQARTDASSICYMPFAQPSFLRAIMSRPSERLGGRLFRRIIRQRAPSLRRYPLVRKGSLIPYATPPLVAVALTRIRRALRSSAGESASTVLLDHLAELVKDTAASQSVREYGGYDYAKVTSLVERYYAGERSLAVQLDWWLAFERYRQLVT